jgi:hypothetical protein
LMRFTYFLVQGMALLNIYGPSFVHLANLYSTV